MAIVKMIKNPPKTKRNLKKLIDYITHPAKTRPDLVGGFNCDWVRAYDDFINTKADFDKEDGIQGKHMVMSFDVRDDITVEMAKQIANEFSQQKIFEGFQVVYAVHRDREHIHTHFLINSVNMNNGKRWHQTSTDLRNMKLKANEICRRYGLSEIELNQGKGNESEIEYRSRFDSWKYEMYLAVVNSARRSASADDFKNLMRSIGYDVKWEKDKKYITFTTPDGKKCRNRKLYPRYKFTKEALEKQFNDNLKHYGAEKMKHFQQILIDTINSQNNKKYPFSSLVENEDNIKSMQYQEWYDKNRDYLLDDDKFDIYKCVGYALKYATDKKDFKERLNRICVDAEFDTEANISVFISKQGIEYSNSELYQGEKYTPDKLSAIFAENKAKKDFNTAFWNCVKNTKSMKDFQNMFIRHGYSYKALGEEYQFFDSTGRVMDTKNIDDKVNRIFENKMHGYLNRFKWKAKNIEEFLALLKKDGCLTDISGDMISFTVSGVTFSHKDLKINSLKKYYEDRDDAQELRRVIGRVKMQALSKNDFINKVKELGYEAKWCEPIPYPENSGATGIALSGVNPKLDELAKMELLAYKGKILFTSSMGNEFDGRTLNTSPELSGWFDMEGLEKQFHKNVCRYLKSLRWQSKSFGEFFEKLRNDGYETEVDNDIIKYHIEGQIFTDADFNFQAINNYFDFESDKRELRNAVWHLRNYALSKQEFVDEMEKLGYKVEWQDAALYDESSDAGVSIEPLSQSALADLDTASDLASFRDKITFTTKFGNKFDNIVDLKPPEIFSNAALEKQFRQNHFNNDFNILCNFLHIFASGDNTPVTTSMSLVGSELTGEKLREFMYHFEQGTASIYNRNLENDFSM